MEQLGIGMALVQIIWINILLSGDNALVIALACRSLPENRRRLGIILGAGAAVLLRIIFTAGIAQVMEVPYLKAIGGLLLVWIAIKLLAQEDEDEGSIAGHDNLWRAVWTVLVADAVMSLDNVLAIAGAAHGNMWLIIFGLAVSVPLVVAGSTLIVNVINRYPLLVWAGAGFLGWIAGEMLMEDNAIIAWLHPSHPAVIAVGIVAALLVLAVGWLQNKQSARVSAE